MKTKYFVIPAICISLLVIGLNLYSSPTVRNPESTSTTTTIDYNIEAYNRTGSLTFQWGTSNNKAGKFCGYVRVLDGEGKIIQEITPQKLEKKIKHVEMIKKLFNAKEVKDTRLTYMVVSLQEFKEVLENETEFNAMVAKFNSRSSGFPFSYTISTIRDQQETLSGTIH